MPPAVNPLSYDEHREMAHEIRKNRAVLLHLASVAISAYGPNSRTGFTFKKMTDAMDKLCEELHAQAELDCPGLDAGAFYTGAKT